MNDWDVVHPGEAEMQEEPEDISGIIEASSATTREKKAEHLISEFAYELRKAHTAKYDIEKAELTAALCLDAQVEISEFLAEAELIAKEKKFEVESIEAEQYFYYKSNPDKVAKTTSDKPGKITDAALNFMVAKDEKVKAAKRQQYEAEANYNKWKNLFNTLKEGHIFFRSIMKGKSEF